MPSDIHTHPADNHAHRATMPSNRQYIYPSTDNIPTHRQHTATDSYTHPADGPSNRQPTPTSNRQPYPPNRQPYPHQPTTIPIRQNSYTHPTDNHTDRQPSTDNIPIQPTAMPSNRQGIQTPQSIGQP
ncbi:hypothetical protein AVEN_172257-1 [Araneus ventricosus]|uniref:Uncharacterized protein n=1 Tax=Araneus ventricosus TaxID=182803 RepID=A0A4Y1ZT24_ARAVE|nr:hypothetical protein AVEN_172257-1 [Araneus ventricosus]